MEIHIGDRVAEVSLVNKKKNKVQVIIDNKTYEVDIAMAENGSCSILHNGNSYNAELTNDNSGKQYNVNIFHRSFLVEIVDTQAKYLRLKNNAEERQEEQIVAPMPGKVIKIHVQKGDLLKNGDTAIVLEAMKMQSNFKVSAPCKIKEVLVAEGDLVNTHQILIKLELLKES